MPSTETFKRYRFSVPNADVSINEWVKQQSNLSMSLRMLIGECIERNGYGDYTCRERIPGARRGRPPKSSYANAEQDEQDLTASDDNHSVVAPVSAQSVPAKSESVDFGTPDVMSDDDIAKLFNL